MRVAGRYLSTPNYCTARCKATTQMSTDGFSIRAAARNVTILEYPVWGMGRFRGGLASISF